MKRFLIYLIIPLQIIVLLLVPRFGWHIHHPSATVLNYTSTYRENGYTHTLYSFEDISVDIAYKSRFLRDFYINVDGDERQHIKVFLDGGSAGEQDRNLLYTGSDIVWKDSSGIFYRVYIFALGLTLMSILLYKQAKKKAKQKLLIYKILSVILLGVSLLVSLRIMI